MSVDRTSTSSSTSGSTAAAAATASQKATLPSKPVTVVRPTPAASDMLEVSSISASGTTAALSSSASSSRSPHGSRPNSPGGRSATSATSAAAAAAAASSASAAGGTGTSQYSAGGSQASSSPTQTQQMRAASLPNGAHASGYRMRAASSHQTNFPPGYHWQQQHQQHAGGPSGFSYAPGSQQGEVAAAASAMGIPPAGIAGQYTPGRHKVPSSGVISYERHFLDLTSTIITFLGPLLPTEEEYRVKEATRRQLERLAGRVSPGAKLLAFGSMANGFALRNSDMDLCCLTGNTSDPQPSASELVEILAQLIREETDFNVMPLPNARIPIIKINRTPTPDLPYEIACDIGFENRLALENTRLLLSYAMVDPPRLRTMVLFLKVWTKRRKLNSPYTGTLSSYGYTLMALYFLTHVKKPPVLPNLQKIPPNRPLVPSETSMDGFDIYFYDDIATLRSEWASANNENVGELLVEFFVYFANHFHYQREVISLRSETGSFQKDGINWVGELCIEDPFQAGYNVSRPVTKDGLYTIRGEFMRASRILSNRHQRASLLIAELCKEREDGLTRAPSPHSRARQGSHNSFDSPVRRQYGNASGVGGSFAFEAMARGLGKGQQNPLALLPTAAMLAPLSHNAGLTGKPLRNAKRRGPPSQANGVANVNISSAKSDDGQGGGANDADRLRVPYNGVSPGAYALDPAVDLDVSRGGDGGAGGSPSSSGTSLEAGGRSFSDSLARSKSLPRPSLPPSPSSGAPRYSQPPSPMTRAQKVVAASPGVNTPPMNDMMAVMDGLAFRPGEEGAEAIPRTGDGKSAPSKAASVSKADEANATSSSTSTITGTADAPSASTTTMPATEAVAGQDSPYADVSTRSSPYQYQTHSPWTFLQPAISSYVPYTAPGSATGGAAATTAVMAGEEQGKGQTDKAAGEVESVTSAPNSTKSADKAGKVEAPISAQAISSSSTKPGASTTQPHPPLPAEGPSAVRPTTTAASMTKEAGSNGAK